MNETIYFYRENKKYGELSNFYRLDTPIIYAGREYATSEHLYQSLKYLYQNAPQQNLLYAEEIRKASTPYKAKLLANRQKCTQYEWQRSLNDIMNRHPNVQIRANLEDCKFSVMYMAVDAKFQQNEHCRKILLLTHPAVLVENSTDMYWGIGRNKTGANKLGIILQIVRMSFIS